MMRHFRSKGGLLRERPFYERAEIERICHQELEQAGLMPSRPAPIRIDRFVEKRFGVEIEYADLGAGILGYTRFGRQGVQAVVVSRALDQEGTEVADRRIRSTLAHEAGHGLLHAHLFVLELDDTPLLFGESTPAGPKVLCRDDEPARGGYTGKWWEFQANCAIGALLLPRRLTLNALEPFTEGVGRLGVTSIPAERRAGAIAHLAETFNVNGVVAKFRLEELYPTVQGIQGQL